MASTLRAALFPRPPRSLPWARPVQVLARTLHIAAMGVLLGGVAFGVGVERLWWPIALTIASGVLLFAIDLAKSAVCLYQGSGVAVLLKLALLVAGQVFADSRIWWYLAATVVASIGSHMPGSWRHYSFIDRRVLDTHA